MIISHLGVSAIIEPQTSQKKGILKDVSCRMRSGEIHVLMGKNGSGKSTLAMALSGHPDYVIDSGSCVLEKTELVTLSADERARAGLFVSFQTPIEIAGVSVFQLIKTAYEQKFGLIENVLNFYHEVEREATLLGIPTASMHRSIHEGFSGGEKKRLELLQMKFLKPRFAFIDEIDSGLDVDAITMVSQYLKEMVADSQMGCVIITHYERLLKYLPINAVHLMSKGSIVTSGDTSLADQIMRDGFDSVMKKLEL
ncbi:MAG: Fe-S cluster assembly ATPase SufC [Candidatus Pacebacteria bacterium RIFOXYB1_FULL_44_10]|nr:MAG: Fe-S cluster assembly ATPase SufC [Candidatus Pacebacteria bacterium RIFOXYB1_FULL_44_10]